MLPDISDVLAEDIAVGDANEDIHAALHQLVVEEQVRVGILGHILGHFVEDVQHGLGLALNIGGKVPARPFAQVRVLHLQTLMIGCKSRTCI